MAVQLEKQTLRYDETLIVVADMDFAPYSTLDDKGEVVGADVELLARLEEKLQKNMRLYMMTWPDAVDAVTKGDADVIMSIDYRPSAYPEIDLSIPIHSDPFVAFSSREITHASDLYNLRIGILEMSNSFTAFIEPHQLQANVTAYSTYTEAFQALENNEVDVCIATYAVGNQAVKQLGKTTIKASGPHLASSALAIGVAAGREGLLDEVNGAILALMNEGVIDTLNSQWVDHYVEKINIRDYLKAYALQIMSGMLVGCIAIIVIIKLNYNKRLEWLNEQRNLEKKIMIYRTFITDATKDLFEAVYEADVTTGRPLNEATRLMWVEVGGMVGESYDEVIKRLINKHIIDAFKEAFFKKHCFAQLERCYQEGNSHIEYDFIVATKEGEHVWYRAITKVFYDTSDEAYHMIQFIKSIDQEKRKEQLLVRKTKQDSMTGLYNKATTEEMIQKALDEICEEPGIHALIVLDIDAFKSVNDTYGHAFGDSVIKHFTHVLRHNLRATDIIGRVGGDEFAVFLTDIPSMTLLHQIAANLVAKLNDEVAHEGGYVRISASVGIACVANGEKDFEKLFAHADDALYASKRRGRNCYTIFEEMLETKA